jgi:hypothetical protein
MGGLAEKRTGRSRIALCGASLGGQSEQEKRAQKEGGHGKDVESIVEKLANGEITKDNE